MCWRYVGRGVRYALYAAESRDEIADPAARYWPLTAAASGQAVRHQPFSRTGATRDLAFPVLSS
jgi:hypothetical protein